MNKINNHNENNLYSSNEVLQEMLKWIKFFGKEKLRNIILENLKEDYILKLYHLSDGKSTARELADILPISHTTVTKHWNDWHKLGIVEKIEVMGGGSRGKKLFELSEIGIDIQE